MSPEGLLRAQKDYSEIAGETVRIEQSGNAIYAFCSEIGTLRLFRKMPNMRQGYSENMKSFYFSVELKFSAD
jgi:hypothetical protein